MEFDYTLFYLLYYNSYVLYKGKVYKARPFKTSKEKYLMILNNLEEHSDLKLFDAGCHEKNLAMRELPEKESTAAMGFRFLLPIGEKLYLFTYLKMRASIMENRILA